MFIFQLDKIGLSRRDKKDKAKGHRPPSIDENGSASNEKLREYELNLKRMTENQLNKEFENLLDDMNLNEEKKAPLRRQSQQQKMTMLSMQFKNSTQSRGVADVPDDFIAALKRNDIRAETRAELIESLRVALTNNPVRFARLSSLFNTEV